MSEAEITSVSGASVDGLEPARPSGPEVIASYLKVLAGSPGVYRMIDAKGDVIYVGKACNLKARVSNYARLGGHSNRIARMIASTVAMEFVNTKTESEALLLEANLIKRFRPRFNVLLRDDKSFPYILITSDHEAPQIVKHRGARNRKGEYFGPFASAGAVNRTINTLQRAFLLRSCSDTVYETRTRPCLLFQIKRCSAPCTGEIGIAEYRGLVEEARRFLNGGSQVVREHLQALMREASERLEFESAAIYRNRLHAISHVTSEQSINLAGIEEADVFAAHQEGGQTAVEVYFFRTGQNWGNRAYFPRADKALTAAEVLDSFIAQFYDDKPVPRLILLSHDIPSRELMAEALGLKAEHKVEIHIPQRGEKRDVVQHALDNAREALGRRLAEGATQRTLLEGLGKTLGLAATPRRVEVYDNSHIQGSSAVGAMIVAGADGFAKSQYRKFNIKSEELAPGDDYGMMREVLTRRFRRLGPRPQPAELEPQAAAKDASDGNDAEAAETGDAGMPDRPDLVLIDGGPGQLKVATEVLAEAGADDVALLAIAKGPDRDAGREHLHMPGRPVFILESRDPVLYFLQRLRDEAHRFVIGTHRAKRSKAIGVNPLDEIAGIGPSRKRALLNHFGSAKAVSRAGIEDLKVVEGISAQMAQAIYDFFHEGER